MSSSSTETPSATTQAAETAQAADPRSLQLERTKTLAWFQQLWAELYSSLPSEAEAEERERGGVETRAGKLRRQERAEERMRVRSIYS